MRFLEDLPAQHRCGLASMRPTSSYQAEIDAAVLAFPEALRPMLARMAARFGVGVLEDVSVLLGMVAQ